MDKPKKILFDLMDIGGIEEIRLTCVELQTDFESEVRITLLGQKGKLTGKYETIKDFIDIGAWGYFTARLNTGSSNQLEGWFNYLETQTKELQEYHRLEAIYGNKEKNK